MRQIFDFDHIKEGDVITSGGVRGTYEERKDGSTHCIDCVFQHSDCMSIPCDSSHFWKSAGRQREEERK